MRAIFAALLLGVFAPAMSRQEQTQIQDLTQLMGKRVARQRMPLCQPGTGNFVRSYEGKEAKVVSITPSKVAPRLSRAVMDPLTPEARGTILGQPKAATVLLQFADGAPQDTCAAIAPAKASGYLKLAAGEAQSPVPLPHPSAEPTNNNGTPPTRASAENMLSEAEVQAAMNGVGREHRVRIFNGGPRAGPNDLLGGNYIGLLLPEAQIALANEDAKSQFRSYEPSEEERKRSLTVVAHGYVNDRGDCVSITSMLLTSTEAGGLAEEPYLAEPGTETLANQDWDRNACLFLRAKFSLAGVQKVRAAAKNGEFFVSVFSDNKKVKTYKIKRKHQAKLGLS